MANYPSADPSFATKNSGDIIQPAHVNDLQSEVVAIGSALRGTLAHALTVNGQIVFPAAQNASAGANTLDDYEEGTWTPALGGSGGQSGQVYSTQVGNYTKIGNVVHALGRITLSTLGTLTGTVRITGLPFAVAASSWAPITMGYHTALTTAVVSLSGYGEAGASHILLFFKTAAATGDTNSVVQGDLSNTTDLLFSIVYRV